MSALKTSATHNATQATLFETRVAMALDSAHCLLADGRQASRAYSCLTVLQAGDLVLVADGGSGSHVLHVLARSDTSAPQILSAVSEGELQLRGRSLRLHALESAAIISGGDAQVTALSGSLSLNARNLFMTVSESLVQQSRHFIGKAMQYMIDARHLLKLHGQDALITAERDIKADAQRISMG